MRMPQLVVTAVLIERRTKSEVARQYGASRRWVITLVQRYLAEGAAGLPPRSRRLLASPQRTTQEFEDEILAMRKDPDKNGHEAGRFPSRSAPRCQSRGLHHLADPQPTSPSRSTLLFWGTSC
jgi:hypothetical protein